MCGKGDAYRKVDRKKWDENPIWEAMKSWKNCEDLDNELEEREALEDE